MPLGLGFGEGDCVGCWWLALGWRLSGGIGAMGLCAVVYWVAKVAAFFLLLGPSALPFLSIYRQQSSGNGCFHRTYQRATRSNAWLCLWYGAGAVVLCDDLHSMAKSPAMAASAIAVGGSWLSIVASTTGRPLSTSCRLLCSASHHWWANACRPHCATIRNSCSKANHRQST